MIKVLLADDHPVVQNVLARFLRRTDDIEIVTVVSDGSEVLNQTLVHSPDVVTIDISMPNVNGIEVMKQIRVQCPQTHVLVLSGYNDSEHIQHALQAGAMGYVLKDFLAWDLVLAIRSLYQGKPYFSNQIAEMANAYVDAQTDEIASKDKAP